MSGVDAGRAAPRRRLAGSTPALGPYSSRSADTLDTHFAQMAAAGIDAAVLSWTGRPDAAAVSDTQGVVTDNAVAARRSEGARRRRGDPPRALRGPPPDVRAAGPRVPRGRVRRRAPPHAAAAVRRRARALPVVYVYDAYHNTKEDWAELLCPGGARSIRGTAHDVVAIATLLDARERALVDEGCFDGFYTYFATEGFTFGSTARNWAQLATWARERNLHFSPSVGPGYNDTRVRPWNRAATRDRADGRYYTKMLRSAATSGADMISITSFNEWGEGTQIEPAARPERGAGTPAVDSHLAYEYPDMYLDITRKVVARFKHTRPPEAEL
ncbi:glycoprotein endo-alpha-1,2-mannosidase-like protein [Aureococcus anophagefferens]|nr:glycoprotein endo-alpha-1,2-mannosidase-like protein [Aureococcus anophagefferens]